MKMTPLQTDALKEIINIGVGRAASMLNKMVNHRVELQVPSVDIRSTNELRNELIRFGEEFLSTVRLDFKGDFTGTTALVFPAESAPNLVAAVTDENLDTTEIDSLKVGTLNEVGNIVLNGVMGSIGNIFNSRLTYTIPFYSENTIDKIVELCGTGEERQQAVILARTSFKIRQLSIDGDILMFFEVRSFLDLTKALETFNPTSG